MPIGLFNVTTGFGCDGPSPLLNISCELARNALVSRLAIPLKYLGRTSADRLMPLALELRLVSLASATASAITFGEFVFFAVK